MRTGGLCAVHQGDCLGVKEMTKDGWYVLICGDKTIETIWWIQKSGFIPVQTIWCCTPGSSGQVGKWQAHPCFARTRSIYIYFRLHVQTLLARELGTIPGWECSGLLHFNQPYNCHWVCARNAVNALVQAKINMLVGARMPWVPLLPFAAMMPWMPGDIGGSEAQKALPFIESSRWIRECRPRNICCAHFQLMLMFQNGHDSHDLLSHWLLMIQCADIDAVIAWSSLMISLHYYCTGLYSMTVR